jgi:glutamate synthase (NADPH) small chain
MHSRAGREYLEQSSRATPGLKTNKRNYIEADTMTQRTALRGVFAGGDIVTGSATVILAMGAGQRAVKSIHEYLTSGEW